MSLLHLRDLTSGECVPRDSHLIYVNEVVVFCWGAGRGIGVGEHGISHGCWRHSSHRRMLLGGAEECTLMGAVTPPGLEGEGVSGLRKNQIRSVSGFIYTCGSCSF